MSNKRKLKLAWRIVKNKYVLTTIVFFIWLIAFDNNSIIDRISLGSLNRNLKEQREHYKNQINDNKERMEELQGSTEKLEKFAREQYLMKKEEEELFIIIEE